MQDRILSERFSRYRGDLITVADIMSYDWIQAEVANSGSEGVYVEVARWNEQLTRWERFAFKKYLGGEIVPNSTAKEDAQLVAQFINGGDISRGFVHAMPTYANPQQNVMAAFLETSPQSIEPSQTSDLCRAAPALLDALEKLLDCAIHGYCMPRDHHYSDIAISAIKMAKGIRA